MHLFDKSVNFLGGHGIVGAHLPLATGVGFAIKYQGGDQVILCFFGDGAVPEGEFHESLNLAALWKLPVIFICENNRYAMGTAIHRALAQTEIWKFAETYGMPGEAVDGMDVLAMRDAVGRAVDARARGQDARASSRRAPTASAATRCAIRPARSTAPRKRSSSEKLRDPIVALPRALPEGGRPRRGRRQEHREGRQRPGGRGGGLRGGLSGAARRSELFTDVYKD